VRVYQLPEWVEGVRTKGAGTYACLLSRGSTFALQPTRRGRTFGLAAAREHIELAGTMVAFVEAQRGVDTACFSIGVIDVESGPRVLLSTGVGCSVDGGFVKSEHPTDLVVNEHGSVAWIVAKSGFGHPSNSIEVHSETTSQAEALLDSAPGIVPGSLRLAPGGEVSWLDGGRTLYADLP